jgi:hypothetical protein
MADQTIQSKSRNELGGLLDSNLQLDLKVFNSGIVPKIQTLAEYESYRDLKLKLKEAAGINLANDASDFSAQAAARLRLFSLGMLGVAISARMTEWERRETGSEEQLAPSAEPLSLYSFRRVEP